MSQKTRTLWILVFLFVVVVALFGKVLLADGGKPLLVFVAGMIAIGAWVIQTS